jgi:uncharacterized protein
MKAHPPACPAADGAESRLHALAFLLIAFAGSWSCWLAAAWAHGPSPLAAQLLSGLGGFGPTLAALAVTGWSGGRSALRRWLTRCLAWRIGLRPYVWAFCLPLAVLVPTLLVQAGLGGQLGPSPGLAHLPLALANLVLILLLGGPLGEELGWRGWAWPALRARWGWRASSLILGLVWGLWHLPLFFIEGSLQSRLPFWPFLASTVALSVVFGWLSERSAGSVLPALTLHTAVNWWAWLFMANQPGLLDSGQGPLALALALLALLLLATGLLAWPARQWAQSLSAVDSLG